MGEEVTARSQGSNGERLEVTLGGKSLGISARDLLPVLVLLAGVTGGYLLYERVHAGQMLLYTRQEQVLQHLGRLEAARGELAEILRSGNAQIRADVESLIRRLDVHEFNQGKDPSERYPLGINGPPREGR